ncbi:metallophosphoesterase family protein [Pseudomonas sp. MAFF212428]|uniref:Metallophosphoesterase family protein n=1 Tax=Pseudomonas brassicae TaxID=2708063 RepID=A0A6B3NRI1_9PSED|nr:metallophosphoesterase family protein [Pseudomonas brassicae]NER59353.1 metallophosphoesterase family protein [Pseudomonas brassicae]NER65805.1 metallophosphoesterase family protein [Pseudomonas brassicae]
MKTAFISDIHGNYEALSEVLAEIDRLGVTRVYCAGDVVGYYAQVNECCAELRERQIPCVMGNHDWYMAGNGFCPRSHSVNDCLAYLRTIIEPEHLEWLRTFPLQREIGDVRMVHGGWGDPLDEYLKPSAQYFEQLQGRAFVTGHTHHQTVQHFGDKVYCNPGSVGQPRDGDPRAAFAIYESGTFTLHRVEYDMQKVFDLMHAAGFNDYYYGGLKTGAARLQRLAD